MIKVITYGTYDLLHIGHIRLLERAKALGDYLIVGVTADNFDRERGKINVHQSLAERMEAVRQTGIADEVIVEEYEGQKIDDIQRCGVDIFTVGDDWAGQFDYLNEYCKVVYLERTKGISSTELRSRERRIRIGFYGDGEGRVLNKYCDECQYVNGAEIAAVCSNDPELTSLDPSVPRPSSFDALLDCCDAVYIISHPTQHAADIRRAILRGKHVLVEMPVALSRRECSELYALAEAHHTVLMPAMKTAYATAYRRLLLLLRSGKIGSVISVDATCTSLREIDPDGDQIKSVWNSICAWGPTAMLPIFQILGTDYRRAEIASYFLDKAHQFDAFTRVSFMYDHAVASLKVGRGVKSEGELVVSGTKGYLYVPAPWWKTDYFEIRFEHREDDRKYFYHLEGEGIRNELVAFVDAIRSGKGRGHISQEVAEAVSDVLRQFYEGDTDMICGGEGYE